MLRVVQKIAQYSAHNLLDEYFANSIGVKYHILNFVGCFLVVLMKGIDTDKVSWPFRKFLLIDPVALIKTVRRRKSAVQNGNIAFHSRLFPLGPKSSICCCNISKFHVPLSIHFEISNKDYLAVVVAYLNYSYQVKAWCNSI